MNKTTKIIIIALVIAAAVNFIASAIAEKQVAAAVDARAHAECVAMGECEK